MMNALLLALCLISAACLSVAAPTKILSQASEIKEAYDSSSSRSFFLDFDDTLFDGRYSMQSELAKIRDTLQPLADDPQNKVYIITMRHGNDLSAKFSRSEFDRFRQTVYFGGENGLYVSREGDRRPTRSPRVAVDRQAIDAMVRRHLSGVGAPEGIRFFHGGEFIYSFSTKGIPNDSHQIRLLEAAIRRELGRDAFRGHELIRSGNTNEVWSILPQGGTKGDAVEELLRTNPSSFALTMGDGLPDESMHALMTRQKWFSMQVGGNPHFESNAKYRIGSPDGARALLRAFHSAGPSH